MQNGFVESLNGRFRDECLNEHLFRGLHAARQIIEAWRIDYTYHRPHTSLRGLTPNEPGGTEADAQKLSTGRRERMASMRAVTRRSERAAHVANGWRLDAIRFVCFPSCQSISHREPAYCRLIPRSTWMSCLVQNSASAAPPGLDERRYSHGSQVATQPRPLARRKDRVSRPGSRGAGWLALGEFPPRHLRSPIGARRMGAIEKEASTAPVSLSVVQTSIAFATTA